MDWLLIAASYIVLHNSLDKESREFVAALPAGNTYTIIDWYKDDEARYKYVGPPPSAFPTVVVDDGAGHLASIRKPATLDAVKDAPFESVVVPKKYCGGVHSKDLAAVKELPFIPINAKKLMEKFIAEKKAKDEAKP